MVELNHNVANINADGLVKGGHGVIVSVHVSKKGSSGAKVVLKNGITSGAPAELTVFGEEVQQLEDIHRRFEAGIYADVTGSAEYVIVFK
jgi:hypothetical protein|tara:strand:+ start:185 stop:454 length:270 start_codon:yes stop_codon:yes gene_type:complete